MTPIINEYIKENPKQKSSIGAAIFSFGINELERLILEAKKLNKKLVIKGIKNQLDGLTITFA